MRRLFQLLRDPYEIDPKVFDRDGNGMVGWGEFCYAWKTKRISLKLSVCERIFAVFDDPTSCTFALFLSCFVLLTITISSSIFILSTVPEFQEHYTDGRPPNPVPILASIEIVCLFIFCAEYFIRVATCWANRADCFDKAHLLDLVCGYDHIHSPSVASRMLKFVFAPGNLIAFAAFMPGIIDLLPIEGGAGGSLVVLRLIKLTRIARAFRLGKYMEPVIVISRTVKKSTRALYVLLFNLFLGIVIFGSLMFLTEQGEWESHSHTWRRHIGMAWNMTTLEYEDVFDESPFVSIPHSFWWALVTSTTVGYGDDYPTTSMGKFVSAICMIWSLVILALPVGVIGGTFTQVWDDFAIEKKHENEKMRREMEHVAAAIQRIEPSKVSRLCLIEVWNDPDVHGLDDKQPHGPRRLPVTPEDFMGEARFELDLPEDRASSGKLTVGLKSNPNRCRRAIKGSVTIRYEWNPGIAMSQFTAKEYDTSLHDAPPKSKEQEAADDQALQNESEEEEAVELSGQLRLTVERADKLITLDTGGAGVHSNPYAIVICYPRSPPAGTKLRPTIWRTPTEISTQRPCWEAQHCFKFVWYAMSPNTDIRAMVPAQEVAKERPASPERRKYVNPKCIKQRVQEKEKTPDELLALQMHAPDRSDEDDAITPRPPSRASNQGKQGYKYQRGLSPQGDTLLTEEALALLRSLASSLPQLANDVKQVSQEVKNLSARVDRIGSSAGLGGALGPESLVRPGSRSGKCSLSAGGRRIPPVGDPLRLLAESGAVGRTALETDNGQDAGVRVAVGGESMSQEDAFLATGALQDECYTRPRSASGRPRSATGATVELDLNVVSPGSGHVISVETPFMASA